MFKSHVAVAIAGLLYAAVAFGQRYTSPPANASVKVAGKEVRVEYYAPSMHGRKIMGNLVPYGKVWCPGEIRFGANLA